MQKGLSSSRTGYNSSASLYGGDLTVQQSDADLESYWKKGSNKKKKNANQQPQQQKKAKKSHTPAGFQNLGYGNIDESSSLVFSQTRVQGRCLDLEKDYLRLTSQADPDRVRSPATLAKALTMVKRKWIDTQDYEWCCNQLKSIRQDCTVQHLKDKLTVEVYETHARIALESLDYQEFAQCQTQLQLLYKDGVTSGLDRECEFAAYKVLYSCLMTGPSDSGLMSFLNGLGASHRQDPAVIHALQVRSALLTTDFAKFFDLWNNAPNMSAYIMDPLADSMRVRSARILVSAYRPTLALSHITHALAFDREDNDEAAIAASAPASSSSSSAAAAVPRPAPTQTHMRACRAYLDSKFEGLFSYIVEPASADGLGPPRVLVDCKATHERLAPTNAAHRLPINSARAKHTVSVVSASAQSASAAQSHAPIAPTHDVGMWIKKDLSGCVKLGSLATGSPSMKPLSSSSGTGQPRPLMSRVTLSSPSVSPSPPPPAASAASATLMALDDAVSRKRKNSQPLSSLSYDELKEQIEQTEAVLLDQNAKEKYDEFNLQLMMSRLKALQKQFKKTKKGK